MPPFPVSSFVLPTSPLAASKPALNKIRSGLNALKAGNIRFSIFSRNDARPVPQDPTRSPLILPPFILIGSGVGPPVVVLAEVAEAVVDEGYDEEEEEEEEDEDVEEETAATELEEDVLLELGVEAFCLVHNGAIGTLIMLCFNDCSSSPEPG